MEVRGNRARSRTNQPAETRRTEVRRMPKGMKDNEGNKYNTNPNYADQVVNNHEVQPAQNNPRESDDTPRHS
ncbi:hypothetical protein [Paenibacillus flagellatus]|uniref:hypothetical protein n=1 Tax=Paenibacillus flagellatus TaxID=2211139 RepID=UPI0011B57EFC|nr:hypothetical protein [Paenibacillus flagellatus]